MTEQEIEALCLWIEDGGPECAPNELRNSALKDALTAIRQLQQPWRGMETAPLDGTRVLLGSWAVEAAGAKPVFRQSVGFWNAKFDYDYDDDGKMAYRGAWTDLTVASFSHEEYTELNPTAWMPLPTPPETGQ